MEENIMSISITDIIIVDVVLGVILLGIIMCACFFAGKGKPIKAIEDGIYVVRGFCRQVDFSLKKEIFFFLLQKEHHKGDPFFLNARNYEVIGGFFVGQKIILTQDNVIRLATCDEISGIDSII